MGKGANRDDILEGVRACVAAALSVPPEDIRPESRLIDDLGADSLDLLDIVFQLERRFTIKLALRDLEKQMKEDLGDTPVEVAGVYTPEAMARIRRLMTEVPPDELPDDLRVADLPSRFRVSTLTRWVEHAREVRHA